MDFPLAVLLGFVIIVGYNARRTGTACNEGEEYYTCRSCEPTCTSISSGLSSNNCSQPCFGGCFCRSGLVRAKDNTCVSPEECFRPVCQENEEFNECGSPCELNCTNLYSDIFCTKSCYSGCFCKQDYVRNNKRLCVLPSACNEGTNQHCGPKEQYVNCVSYCNTCWELNNCRPSFCRPGCDCKPGYYRDYYGQCISESQCYSSLYGLQNGCGQNEEYTSCVNPCNDCTSRGQCPYNPSYCDPGCDCKVGYLRNEMGVCIPEQNCNSQKCSDNEVYLECGPSCRSTCENFRELVYNRCRRDCVPGCHCQGNLVLDSEGKCIRPELCPRVMQADPKCPPSEVFYQCLPTCRTTCKSLNTTDICSTACKPGCFCQPGFVKSNNGTCVRPEDCSPRPIQTCPIGEVFYDCLPCPNTCEGVNSTDRCSRVCRPGCACARGLVKRRDGLCVKQEDCDIVCGDNEEFLRCGPACHTTCANLNRNDACPDRCVMGCFCIKGFVLGPNGACIPRSSCPTTPTPCPAHEGMGVTGRRVGSDEETSTSNSIPTTSQTEIPENVTKKSETKPDVTTTTSDGLMTSPKSDPTPVKLDSQTPNRPDSTTSTAGQASTTSTAGQASTTSTAGQASTPSTAGPVSTPSTAGPVSTIPARPESSTPDIPSSTTTVRSVSTMTAKENTATSTKPGLTTSKNSKTASGGASHSAKAATSTVSNSDTTEITTETSQAVTKNEFILSTTFLTKVTTVAGNETSPNSTTLAT